MQHCKTDCSSTIIARYLFRLWTTVATRLQARISGKNIKTPLHPVAFSLQQASARVNVSVAAARKLLWHHLQSEAGDSDSYPPIILSPGATWGKICRVCDLLAWSGPAELHNIYFSFYGDPPEHTLAVIKINLDQQHVTSSCCGLLTHQRVSPMTPESPAADEFLSVQSECDFFNHSLSCDSLNLMSKFIVLNHTRF